MNYRSTIDRIKHKRDDRLSELKLLKKSLDSQNEDLDDHEAVREYFKKAALLTQNVLSNRISGIVTKALGIVFPEKNVKFIVEFVERRNTTECDLYVEDSKGNRYDLLDDRGHGMADLVSMCLRVSYIMLDSVDNVLILDEPFRNLNRAKQPWASQLVKELSRELDMQFIICTHIPDLVEYADKHIKVTMRGEISKCT